MRAVAAFNHLIDFCYPRVCAACERAGDNSAELCSSCFDELHKLEQTSACERCAMPLAQPLSPCPYCLGEGHQPFERIARLGLYRDPMKHLLHRVKYHGTWNLAEFLADRLVHCESVKAMLAQADLIVPVPLHPWRQMSRGFNQAELIARRLARHSRIKQRSVLVRLKNTETQTQLHSKADRFENLRDAFGLLQPRAVRNRRIVLVDDVMTTGATLSWAARTLLEAEPAGISAIVLAVADPRGRDFETI